MDRIIFLCSFICLLSGCARYPKLSDAPDYAKSPMTSEEVQKEMSDLRQDKENLIAS